MAKSAIEYAEEIRNEAKAGLESAKSKFEMANEFYKKVSADFNRDKMGASDTDGSPVRVKRKPRIGPTKKQQVYEVLKEAAKSMRARDILETMNGNGVAIGAGGLGTTLRSLIYDGKVEKVSTGVYQIKKKEGLELMS